MNQDIARAILQPYFDAVRDTFAEYRPDDTSSLDELRSTRMELDASLHDTPRHYAACRDDGKLILIAPQAVDLAWHSIVAILAHEFGHAADFAYLGHWALPEKEHAPAVWVGRPKGRRLAWWHGRNNDQIELTADAISYSITGTAMHYCGDCLVQCFDPKGKKRPRGLR